MRTKKNQPIGDPKKAAEVNGWCRHGRLAVAMKKLRERCKKVD